MDVIEAQAADVPGTLAARGLARDSDRVERLRGVLSEARPTDGRTALVSVGVDDVLPLPDLEELWAREVPRDDDGQHATRCAPTWASPSCSSRPIAGRSTASSAPPPASSWPAITRTRSSACPRSPALTDRAPPA